MAISGGGNYTRTSPRGCPGSYARVTDVKGWGVCPFCRHSYRINKSGTLHAHTRGQ